MGKKKREIAGRAIAVVSLLIAFTFLFIFFSFRPTGKVSVIAPGSFNSSSEESDTPTQTECSINSGVCISFTETCDAGYSATNFKCGYLEKCCVLQSVQIELGLILNQAETFASICPDETDGMFKVSSFEKGITAYESYANFLDLSTGRIYSAAFDTNEEGKLALRGRLYSISFVNDGSSISLVSLDSVCSVSKKTFTCRQYSLSCSSSSECCSKICDNSMCASSFKNLHYGDEFTAWCDDTADSSPVLQLYYVNNKSDGFYSDEVWFRDLRNGQKYIAVFSKEGKGTINIVGKTYGVNLIGKAGIDIKDYSVTISPGADVSCSIQHRTDLITKEIKKSTTGKIGDLNISVFSCDEIYPVETATITIAGYSGAISLKNQGITIDSKIIEINQKKYNVTFLGATDYSASFKVVYLSDSACIPVTCSELGYTCGTRNDNCDGILNCGSCLSGQLCINGKCQIASNRIAPTENETSTGTAESDEGEIVSEECSSGCLLNEGTCIPYGYRTNTQYCNIDNTLIYQKTSGLCDNNFECKSNVCLNGECASQGLIQRILEWLSGFFQNK